MNKFKKMLKNKKGFTLVELIVVVAILGILATIAVPRLTGFQETARERADLANAKTIANAVATLRATEQIALGTYILTGAPGAGTDLEEIFQTLNNDWPTPTATARGAGNTTFVVIVGANDDITVNANTATNNGTAVELFPTPAAGYTN